MKPARIIILAVAVVAAGLAGVLAMRLTGGTPAASSAGKEKKVPPPARAFMVPARKAPPATRSVPKISVLDSNIHVAYAKKETPAAWLGFPPGPILIGGSGLILLVRITALPD